MCVVESFHLLPWPSIAYQLPNYAEDAYSSMFSEANEVKFAQVLRTVAVEGTDWIRSGRRGAWSYNCQFLTEAAKQWFYFIHHTIMPTRHVFTLN